MLGVGVDARIGIAKIEGGPEERCAGGFFQGYARFAEEGACVGGGCDRRGMLGVWEDEDVRGLDLLFLNARRSNVDLVTGFVRGGP